MPEIEQGDSQAAMIQIQLAFSTIVSASAPPYGYTVSVWTSGAILMHFRSSPNVGDVFLFAAGALLGFALLGLVAHGTLRAAPPLGPGLDSVRTGPCTGSRSAPPSGWSHSLRRYRAGSPGHSDRSLRRPYTSRSPASSLHSSQTGRLM